MFAPLALILVVVMVAWLIRDLTRSLRIPHWPAPRKDEDR
jgi:hypothetical protein